MKIFKVNVPDADSGDLVTYEPDPNLRYLVTYEVIEHAWIDQCGEWKFYDKHYAWRMRRGSAICRVFPWPEMPHFENIHTLEVYNEDQVLSYKEVGYEDSNNRLRDV